MSRATLLEATLRAHGDASLPHDTAMISRRVLFVAADTIRLYRSWIVGLLIMVVGLTIGLVAAVMP